MTPSSAALALGGMLPPRPELTRARRWRMTLSKAVNLFLQEIRVTKAKATATAYESDLNRLIALAGLNTVLAFTPDTVRLFFTTESQRGNGPATLHRKLAALMEFGKWGVRAGLWPANPVATFPRIKKPRTMPRPFSEDEVARLLALELPLQARLIRALLLGSGLRASPLCGLRVGDVSEHPPQVRVLSKGRKVQVVDLAPALAAFVTSYALTATTLKAHEPLFTTAKGRPVARKWLERLTRAWGVAADVADCTPHRFRHTYATALLRQGVDLRVIQELLGHEDLKSTAVYTQVAGEAKAAAAVRLPWRLTP